MRLLPPLGAGFVYQPGLGPVVEAGLDLPAVVEVEPETFFTYDGRRGRYEADWEALRAVANLPGAKLVHGVGFPLGGSHPVDGAHLELFRETIDILGSPWASEHLSINHIVRDSRPAFAGFLLPPLQTASGVACAVCRIQEIRERLPVPLAFETGVNYLKPGAWEIPDGTFFRLVAEAADCGILLDLHNVWANERNGRQSVTELLSALPLDRVWEVHVAGGRPLDGYWLDAHSGLVPDPLRGMVEAIVPQLPALNALVFEIVPDYMPVVGIGVKDIALELRWLDRVWKTRGRELPAAATRRVHVSIPPMGEAIEELQEWERALGALLTGVRETGGRRFMEAIEDPGGEIYRTLIRSVRLGTLVTSLRLSTRLIRLWLGEQEFERRLDAYFSEFGPSLFALNEALAFAEFARSWSDAVPHLDGVLDLELNSTGADETERVASDSHWLVSALADGHLPYELERARKAG